MKLDDEEHMSRREGEMSPGLRAMVAELRAEPPPELPWDAIEARLLQRIERGEGAELPPKSGSALWQLAPICAAAAAIALFVQMGAGSGEPRAAAQPESRVVDVSEIALAPVTTFARGDRDMSALREGDIIETTGASASFARAGVARWTIAPGSRAVVRSVGAPGGVGMIVALERGSIRAEVEPRDHSEGLVDAFAVEASGTRVAVHGTAFSVARAEQSIVVDVEHGVVAVGPAGNRGTTAGYALVGPARASFSLDGGKTARFLKHEEPARHASAELDDRSAPSPSAPLLQPAAAAAAAEVAQATPEPQQPEPPAARSKPSEPTAPAPLAATGPANASANADVNAPANPGANANTNAPAPAPAAAPEPAAPQPTEPPAPAVVKLTPSGLKARIERCIKDTLAARPSSVKVSVASTLNIRVAADGSVISAVLTPPLAPHLAACAGANIGGRFATGPQTVAVPLSVDQ
jgi:hypothetical protein